MYEVVGETVKSATSVKLKEIFGKETKRYKEAVSKMTYPNFFIHQLSAEIRPDTKDRWYIDYFINIRYRYAKDISYINDLEQKLDEVALKLMTEFTEIQLERPVKVRNARYEKVDGVLHFFFNVSVQVQRQMEEPIRQENLKVKEEVM